MDRSERVYVADRENSRVQVFTAEGEFLSEWTNVGRPSHIFIDDADNVYVTEFGLHTGLFPGATPPPEPSGPCVSVFNQAGELQSRWGGGERPNAPGDFFAPHCVCADSRGDLYVGEVTPGADIKDCHVLQKFVRTN